MNIAISFQLTSQGKFLSMYFFGFNSAANAFNADITIMSGWLKVSILCYNLNDYKSITVSINQKKKNIYAYTILLT